MAKEQIIKLRVSAEQKGRIESLSKAAGVSVSEWVRAIVDGCAPQLSAGVTNVRQLQQPAGERRIIPLHESAVTATRRPQGRAPRMNECDVLKGFPGYEQIAVVRHRKTGDIWAMTWGRGTPCGTIEEASAICEREIN